MYTRMKSVDTLQIYERMKKAKTSDAQARELAEILHELVDDQLATKNDLEKVKLELEAEIEQSKNELRAEIEKSKIATIKWIIGWVTGLLLAQTGILVSLR